MSRKLLSTTLLSIIVCAPVLLSEYLPKTKLLQIERVCIQRYKYWLDNFRGKHEYAGIHDHCTCDDSTRIGEVYRLYKLDIPKLEETRKKKKIEKLSEFLIDRRRLVVSINTQSRGCGVMVLKENEGDYLVTSSSMDSICADRLEALPEKIVKLGIEVIDIRIFYYKVTLGVEKILVISKDGAEYLLDGCTVCQESNNIGEYVESIFYDSRSDPFGKRYKKSN